MKTYTEQQVKELLIHQRHNCQIERNKRSILKDGVWYVACEDVYNAEEPLLPQAYVMPSLPNDRKKHMRKQATTIFELTKGFTSEPTDNAMKAALEMAGYVQELTTDVE